MLIPLARAFTRFSMFVYIRARFRFTLIGGYLTAQVDREPRGNWRRNSNSREVVASSPSFCRPAARVPRRACSQVMLLVPQTLKVNEPLLELISFKTSCKHDSNSSSDIDTRISIDWQIMYGSARLIPKRRSKHAVLYDLLEKTKPFAAGASTLLCTFPWIERPVKKYGNPHLLHGLRYLLLSKRLLVSRWVAPLTDPSRSSHLFLLYSL